MEFFLMLKGPMSRAKKLPCNHLFHLACLRSWYSWSIFNVFFILVFGVNWLNHHRSEHGYHIFRMDQSFAEVYSCPTCRRPLFLVNPQRGASSTRQEATTGLALPGGTFPSGQQQNRSDGVWRCISLYLQFWILSICWDNWSYPSHVSIYILLSHAMYCREGGLDPGWVPPWSNPTTDSAGSSSGNPFGPLGISGVQMMMRQLASSSNGFPHSSGEPSASSSTLRYDPNALGLRFRNNPPMLNRRSRSEILPMVARVREILPHIPDDLIIQVNE